MNHRQGKTRGALAAIVLCLAGCWGAPTLAQNYSATIQTGMELGNVAAGKVGDTIFRIDPATGGAFRLSGTAQRTGSASARAFVTITCADAGSPGSCASSNVSVLVGPTGTPTNRARALTNLRVTMNTAVLTAPSTGVAPVSFTLQPVDLGAGKTFYVGADFAIAGDNSGLPSGASQSSFYVYVGKAPNPPVGGAVGAAAATVFRGLTITKTSDLAFGRISRPPVGSGVVAFDAATGLRTVSGDGGGLPTPVPTLAAFTVTGEGGQIFSIAVQPTFVLAGPTPLTVITNSTVAGAQTFNSALGSQGTFNFSVGGSFQIANSTSDGSYSGAFIVTADYN
ncbi:MAG: hypothetical protein JWO33_2216 [Caulobacteraceae bacterium]|nr:hypothetical protein [Caulobacteraceae bacterium]